MDQPFDRLRAARIKAGFETAKAAADRFGWIVSTYTLHENGGRGFPSKVASRYARAFRTTPEWLLYGRGQDATERRGVPIVGYVGAGARVHPFEGDTSPGYIDEADAPPGSDENTEAVIVRGDSMAPAFRDHDTIYYRRVRRAPESLIGRECVVGLATGEVYVKMLQRGNSPGLFNLFSYNAPLLEDQPVEWAVKVRWVDRGD